MTTERHHLDCDNIDELDEINGDVQLAWVWCNTHGKYEWHSLPLDRIERGGPLTVTTKPVDW